MDYARKRNTINFNWKTSKSHQIDGPSISRGNPCAPTARDKPPVEDRRLANWRRWMYDRQRRQQHLATALDRKPLDLSINAHERVRTKKENTELLAAANRPEVVNQDKYRGNPSFWLLDEISDERLGINPRMSRERKNLPPLIERVALPNMILREKMLVEDSIHPTNVNLRCKWERGDYLRSRAEELRRELELLEPKKPEMEDLMVVGKSFDSGDHKKVLTRTPVITYSDVTHAENLPRPNYLQNPDDRIALKIQDREFVLEGAFHFEKLSREKTAELLRSQDELDLDRYAYSVFETNHVYKILRKSRKVLTWDLHFESRGNELTEQIFRFENRGSRTVHLDWRNVTPKFQPQIVRAERCRSPFYFDKDRFKILPGQKRDFKIWYRSEKPLVASETWKLLIEPRVYPDTIHLRLWGTSSGETLKLRERNACQKIKDLIKCRVLDSTVREFIEEIIANAINKRYANDIPYDMFFLEADVFRVRNPMHHYHSLLVDELRTMWFETTANDESCWNMSLEELRSILLKIEDPSLRRSRLVRFHEIATECLLPSALYDRPVCSKRKLARWLIGSYLNQFEEESELVYCKCCGIRCPPEPEEEGEEPEIGATAQVTTGAGETEVSLKVGCAAIYQEVLYVRLYCLLCETVDRVCAALDSYDYFNKETE